MRLSLRNFLIVFSIVVIVGGWFGAKHLKSKKEQQLLDDLSLGLGSDFFVRAYPANDDLYQRYDLERLFALASKYSKIAENAPSESVPARIASAALCHYGARYDVAQNQLICGPKAVTLAEKYYDSKIEPLASASTMILMRYHQLSDDVHSSQYCRARFEDGFDPNDPFDVYVLVTEVYSDFNYSDGEYRIAEDWPIPRDPWDWHLDEPAAHTYDDKVEALRQVSSEAADAYATIVGEVRKCKAESAELPPQKLAILSQELVLALDKRTIFRFMLKNKELFKTNPYLVVLPPQDRQENSEAPSKPKKGSQLERNK